MSKKKTSQSRILDTLRKAYSLHRQNRLDEAWNLYEQVLALDPKLPDALHLSGCIANQRKEYAIAATRIGAALAIVGPNALYLVNHGTALASLNRHEEAEAAFRKAIAIDPASSSAHNNLANLMVRLGRYDEAIAEFDQTLVQAPRHLNALLALGRLLADRKALSPSLTLLRRARDVAPGNEKVLLAQARTYLSANQYDLALEAIETMRGINPDSDEVHTGAGAILFMMRRFGEAIASYRLALQLNPGSTDALYGLVSMLAVIGRTTEALEAIRQRTQDGEPRPWLHSSRLFMLNYLPDMSAREVADAHRDWNARFALPIASDPAWDGIDPNPERPLRIGYVSEDFRTHSVAFFIEPIFEHHDHRQFELYAYHNSTEFDAVTQRLKDFVRHWRDVPTMSDQELAALIRADKIDILVDLGGHTGHYRLLTFARRPAPVQIAYLGYPNTTGLTAIQYRISDAIADPPGTAEALSSEALLRLPDCFHCYRPDDMGRQDFTPPSVQRGAITFASFNTAAKINPPLIGAWARILKAVPDTRLVLKAWAFADELPRKPIQDAFTELGIALDRIVFDAHQNSRADHMARYRQVDIALDTFPYCGTTTTCDALWMGVPVITILGDRHAARVGASLLHACGLDELIANDLDDYVERVLQLASDRPRLASLHGTLRERMRASPLMDETGFVRNLEFAYRDVWRKWCSETESAAQPSGQLTTSHWQLRLAGDISICVPASFAAMTPSILLEQEDWFEAEMGFVRNWLQPGMNVIDIGANYGIYTLNSAHRVGPKGHVWAFEPAPNTRRFLTASVAANHFANVSVEARALSDTSGEAWIQLDWNPELNCLVDGPRPDLNTERIAIETLDDWHAAHPLASPDFIKLDAEGHERKILVGGRQLLAGSSPLVMFELKHGSEINTGLVNDFKALGFDVYQLMPGLGLLTPFNDDGSTDPYVLNLFACKPELGVKLAAAGVLAEVSTTESAPDFDVAPDSWRGLIDSLPCFAGWDSLRQPAVTSSGLADVHFSLGAYAESLHVQLAPARRVKLLRQALTAAQGACASLPSPGRLHTLARIAGMTGERVFAVQAMRQALAALDSETQWNIDEPFLPASPRFDHIAANDPRGWLEAATIECFLQLYRFAGTFANPHEELPLLERAARLPHFSATLERRRQLLLIGLGRQAGPECSPLLRDESNGNLNPAFWCP